MHPYRIPAAVALSLGLIACSGINDSWEVKGGGYIKYKINGGESHTIKTRPEESSRGDQFSIMVNRPTLGNKAPVQGQYSWVVVENTERTQIFADSSTIHFDQKDDSTWTADLSLHALDCRSGYCKESLPRLHITGRLRYWIPAEDR